MQNWRPTLAEINLAALRRNFARARELARGGELIAVVKADAYGHGVLPVVHALTQEGCRRLAVVTTEEAVELREAGITLPILVMGGLHSLGEAEEVSARGVTPALHHAGHLEWMRAVARRRASSVPVQIEVDTGMRRMGAEPAEACVLAANVAAEPALQLEGVYTHLARADEADLAATRLQLVSFRAWLADLRARGIASGLVHSVNSAGLLAADALVDDLPSSAAARPGLMLYGVSPAAHFPVTLEPVMTLRSQIVQLRRLRAGEAVGYGGEFRAIRPTVIATLPIGYGDGVLRASQARGEVLVRGRRVPFAGRISMDFVTLDAGDLPVEMGDEVLLFGARGDARLPVEEVASLSGTIAYELLVRVGSRVPRCVLKE